MLFATLAAVLSLAGPAADSARYLGTHQAESGAIGEAGSTPDIQSTAWAALGLAAARAEPARQAAALEFLRGHEADAKADTDVSLLALARLALGDRPEALLDRVRAQRSTKLVNARMWRLLALRQAGEPAPAGAVQELLAAQRPSGGWPWLRGGQPDSNDTAVAVQALCSAGVSRRGKPIRRALAYLRSRQRADGGFELTSGRGSDAQSTAWAIQAFLAAGEKPGAAAYRYLARLRRSDGSYRYSARYVATPVWVTSQVLPALVGRPFPLRP